MNYDGSPLHIMLAGVGDLPITEDASGIEDDLPLDPLEQPASGKKPAPRTQTASAADDALGLG